MNVRFSTGWVSNGVVLTALTAAVACSGADDPVGSGSEAEVSDTDDADVEAPGTDASGAADSAAAPWIGDGTLDTVELVQVYDAPDQFFCTRSGCRPGLAVDLEFNPVRAGELWVVYRQPYDGQSCNQSDPGSLACELLGSQVAIITDADTANPSVNVLEDGNSWHFMRVVTALAFADNDTFATVGEARTGNWMDHASDFMGPTWWSSKPSEFAVDFGLNGSHLDMLHATPFGMGIAHDPTRWQTATGFDTGPVFWTFNGDIGAVDRYDFKEPHEPGGEDHSDGTLHRYVEGKLKMAPGIPSHMDFANLGQVPSEEGLFGPSSSEGGQMPDWWLYIVDTGNQRVVRLDTKSGTLGNAVVTPDPQLADPRQVDGAVLEEIVPAGMLEAPSGIAVAGDVFFVSDAATSRVVLFDLEGEVLGALDTELPAWSLAGLAIGPDERLYFVDWAEGSVYRVELR